MATIQDIITRIKEYLPGIGIGEDRIMRAYNFAEKAHAGQTRYSGEPYILHPLEVTNILLDFHPDEDAIVASLLHDVAEDTNYGVEDISANFGPKVKELCWGLMKLSKVRSKLDDPHTENLRKLFLAMATDFRVVLIKLCDRLHNMSTFEFIRPEKRRRIAQETLNVYAPIAARLGIYRLKSQLEDLCFRYLHEIDYKMIKDQLVKTEKWREKYIDIAKKILHEVLAKEGIYAEVDGRVKSLYSIYRKLNRKNKNSVEDIFDVFAMRVILPDIYKYDKEYTGHLYTALGIIHNQFTPLANRFKDYVAVPKVNGYRSLHTTVIGLGPKDYVQPTEIQLRTMSMHNSAEFGIAAHWLYELNTPMDDKTSKTLDDAVAHRTSFLFKQHQDWISGLKKIEHETSSNQELLENLQVDVFQDRIFILTPRGDVRDLPAGATPVDFAYSVHTEIGNHCIAAKVNGSIAPLDHQLKSGEVVEIITRKNAEPNHHWLSFIKTSHAKSRIRTWFHDLDEDKHLRTGKSLLNEKLHQLGKMPLDDNLTLLRNYDGKNLNVKARQQILINMGRGSIIPSAVIRKIFTLQELMSCDIASKERNQRGIRDKSSEKKSTSKKDQFIIGGERNMPYHFVKCCDANESDEQDLIGYITRGKGISVHKKSCTVVRASEPNRLIPVNFSTESLTYLVQVKLIVEDRIALIRDITGAIAENSINIKQFAQNTMKNGKIELNFGLELEQFDQLERLLDQLEKIPSVRRAFKAK